MPGWVQAGASRRPRARSRLTRRLAELLEHVADAVDRFPRRQAKRSPVDAVSTSTRAPHSKLWKFCSLATPPPAPASNAPLACLRDVHYRRTTPSTGGSAARHASANRAVGGARRGRAPLALSICRWRAKYILRIRLGDEHDGPRRRAPWRGSRPGIGIPGGCRRHLATPALQADPRPARCGPCHLDGRDTMGEHAAVAVGERWRHGCGRSRLSAAVTTRVTRAPLSLVEVRRARSSVVA